MSNYGSSANKHWRP